MMRRIPTQRPSIFRVAQIVIVAFVAACCAALLTGCYEDQKRKEFKAAGCKFFSDEELSERKYCGKACTRNVRRETWVCGSSPKPYFVSFNH